MVPYRSSGLRDFIAMVEHKQLFRRREWRHTAKVFGRLLGVVVVVHFENGIDVVVVNRVLSRIVRFVVHVDKSFLRFSNRLKVCFGSAHGHHTKIDLDMSGSRTPESRTEMSLGDGTWGSSRMMQRRASPECMPADRCS